MYDHLSIGSTPSGEDCAQLGTEGYAVLAKLECATFIDQLIDTFGEPPLGADLHVRSNAHDFGTYYEVCVRYDPDDPEAAEYAFKPEDETPEFWSVQALLDLAADGLDAVSQNPLDAGILV